MFVTVMAGAMALMLGAPDAGVAAGADKMSEVVEKKDRLVCKSQRTTGSRLTARVCMSADDWKARRAASNRKVEDWQKEPRRPMAENDETGRLGAESSGRQTRVRDRPPPQDRPF